MDHNAGPEFKLIKTLCAFSRTCKFEWLVARTGGLVNFAKAQSDYWTKKSQ